MTHTAHNKLVSFIWSIADDCLRDVYVRGKYRDIILSFLDEFLRMVGNDVLQHAGMISHDQALKKAELEYAKYKEKTKNELSKVEQDFVAFIDTTSKSLESKKKQ